MRSVLISIQPKWCELIASGKKTVEVRKTKPKLETPFKVYIYQTKAQKQLIDVIKDGDEIYGEIYHGKTQFIKTDNDDCHLAIHPIYRQYGKVIGEFVCDSMTSLKADNVIQAYYNNTKETCLTDKEIMQYANNGKLYYWHISDLVIYDKPKELSEFRVLDNESVKKCKYREQTYYSFTDTGYIKNGMYCRSKDDWCTKCKTKPITRPPQSWYYVEE